MIRADIRGMNIEQVAHVTAEAIGALLKESEEKFIADVTRAGVLTEQEARQVLDEQRSEIASAMREPFAKIFDELRNEQTGRGGSRVEAKALEGGAVSDVIKTSTISEGQ